MDNVDTSEDQNQPIASAPDGIGSLDQDVGNQENKEKGVLSDGGFVLKDQTQLVGRTLDEKFRSNIAYTSSKKATASRHLDSRLPAVKSSSVFDRLYKSHTVASKSYTIASRAKLKPSTRSKLRNKAEISIDVDKDLLNFNSMSISRSRRVASPHKIQWQTKGRKTPFNSFSTPQPKKRPSSYNQAPRTAPSKSSTTPRSSTRAYEFSPRMKPLTKLYFISKFHPGIGLEPIAPISLGYTFFQTYCEYESGGIDSEQIAKEIFIAFFKKDHSQGIRRWKLSPPVVVGKNDKSSRGGTAFSLTMNATYSWGNTYRVAHAKGVVRFKEGSQNKEIMVENFTYNLTGDP